MIKKVLITGTSLVSAEAVDYISSRGFEPKVVKQDQFTAAELHEALEDVHGYLIGGYEEPLDVHFERASNLEAVAWVGTDYKAYVPGWQRGMDLGIAFLNSPGTNAASVAEFTILLALTMSRPFTTRIAKRGEKPSDLSAPGHDLMGRRLGIIGMGRIGSHVARIAKSGFGMEVVYSAPRRNEAVEQALGVEQVDKDVLLRSSDIVTLHRPSPIDGEECELGRRELSLVREGTIIVNTVHHGLIDSAALIWAIENRDLRVAQDGTGTGPEWDQLLAFGPDQFLAVPSMAFNTTDANLRASMRTAKGVCDVLAGGSSADVNNPEFRAKRAKGV